uniref:Centromere protein Cenp-F N-terminal domain-containing protein n=1 Tax=Varanus komodoensis TaxID=61221 RepID=A0A8D2LLM8_VARKO
MSWPGEDWKVGLPAQALRAIAEVEQHLARLQKERQQKQVQLDTLEAAMHKQRQKVGRGAGPGVLAGRTHRGFCGSSLGPPHTCL